MFSLTLCNRFIKTDCNIEDWHKAFSSWLAGKYSTIWRLIEILKQEQNLIEIKINQTGKKPTKIYINRETGVKI